MICNKQSTKLFEVLLIL